MDIISHGLWGGIAFGRKNQKRFLLAFAFGVLPDLFSFGIAFVVRILSGKFDFEHHGPPELAGIPSYVDTLYNFTHSLIIFVVIFILVWVIFKRPILEMLAWPFHIILDIFTHSSAFFPTPFLFPLSDFTIDGIAWSHPAVYIPNLTLLLIFYTWFFYTKRKKRTPTKEVNVK